MEHVIAALLGRGIMLLVIYGVDIDLSSQVLVLVVMVPAVVARSMIVLKERSSQLASSGTLPKRLGEDSNCQNVTSTRHETKRTNATQAEEVMSHVVGDP